MKILFIGSVDFSAQALEKLISLDANIIGICTLEKSSFNSDFFDLSRIAKKNGIPVQYSDDINSKVSLDWIKSLSPDIIFCFGWSSLLKAELLNIPSMGVLGFHPALLPQNRGRHPIIWSLALGLSKTGSTFFFMNEGADSGDILSQKEIEISKEDDSSALYAKISSTALHQIEDFLPELIEGKVNKIAQNHSLANYWRKRNYNDGKIDWRMTSDNILNLVKALNKPYPGAHFVYNELTVKVFHLEILNFELKNIEPGKIISRDKNSLDVKSGDGAVRILLDSNLEIKSGDYLN
jgi:methionyl-tRNA formyltransferase